MPLKLRLATQTGEIALAKFARPNGTTIEVPISESDYFQLGARNRDPKKPLITASEKSIRPVGTELPMTSAVIRAAYDTHDGNMAPGDFIMWGGGELYIKLANPAVSVIHALLLEDGEWTGRIDNPSTINADVTVGGVRYHIVDGVLL
jgi:hypothetical protein